jgi:CRP/FNR family transcriptional regulator, cyclic AMP receptor protein
VSLRAPAFDPLPFLTSIRSGRTSREYPRHEEVFAQGASADAVFYIETGKVKLSVQSPRGKTAIVGTVGRGSFFGEGCLAGQPLRISTASTTVPCRIARVAKKTMLRALHREPDFAALFMAYLLSRNAHIEGDLVDQLFNSSEKRLARLLLRLAHFGKASKPLTVIPKMSQSALAEIVGTTPRKIGYFMERFRKLGFVEDGGKGLEVHSALLSIVLRDKA